MDGPRSVLAAGAAAIAGIASVAAVSDGAMSGFDTAGRVFAAEALGGAVLALWPARGGWSERRRVIAGMVAACSTALAPVLLIITSARAACGCGDAASGYRLPTVLGLVADDWVVMAMVAFPVLMAATTVPALDRIRGPHRGASRRERA